MRKAAKSAVCKINIDSDGRLAMTAMVRKIFVDNPAEFDPRKYLGPAREELKKLYMHKCVNVLGSAGTVEKATFAYNDKGGFKKASFFLCIYNNYLSVIGVIGAIYYTYFTYYTYIILHKLYLIRTSLIPCLDSVLHSRRRETLLVERVAVSAQDSFEQGLLLEPGNKV